MITTAVLGAAFLVLVAIVVGIIDSLQARAWREIAAERRRNWEANRLQHHGVHDEVDNGDDE